MTKLEIFKGHLREMSQQDLLPIAPFIVYRDTEEDDDTEEDIELFVISFNIFDHGMDVEYFLSNTIPLIEERTNLHYYKSETESDAEDFQVFVFTEKSRKAA